MKVVVPKPPSEDLTLTKQNGSYCEGSQIASAEDPLHTAGTPRELRPTFNAARRLGPGLRFRLEFKKWSLRDGHVRSKKGAIGRQRQMCGELVGSGATSPIQS